MVLQRLESPLSAACRLGLCSAGEAGVSTYGAQSSSIIKLNNGLVLYLREVNRYLALVCLLREENFEKHGLIDFNFHCFREAILEVFDVRQQSLSAENME